MALTVQQIDRNGLGVNYESADASMTVQTAIGVFLHVRNRSAVELTITTTPPVADEDGLLLRTLTWTVPATSARFIPVFRRAADANRVQTLEFSTTGQVDVAAIRPLLPASVPA